MNNLLANKIYIQIDANNKVVSIASNFLISDFTGWIQIDEGYGEKYFYAHKYLDKGLLDNQSRFNYKYIDGAIVEIPENEKPIPQKLATTNERLSALEEELKALLGV